MIHATTFVSETGIEVSLSVGEDGLSHTTWKYGDTVLTIVGPLDGGSNTAYLLHHGCHNLPEEIVNHLNSLITEKAGETA